MPSLIAEKRRFAGSCGGRRRIILAGLILLAVGAYAAGTSAGPASGAPSQPNFIVLMSDDQTNGEMSVMKQTNAEIVRRGVTFDRFITSYPLCCPSRTTFLTGEYSHNHGVIGNGTPFGGYPTLDKANTLASWLQGAGYHTIQIGKFLNHYPDRSNKTEVPPGWDEWYACLDSSENHYYDYTLNENGVLTHYGKSPAEYKTDVYGNKAVDAIRQRAALGPAGEPFFMFAAFTAPHLPAVPAKRDQRKFRRHGLPKSGSFNEADVSDKPRFIRKLPRFSSGTIAKIKGNYRRRLETLLSVDRAVGRIMAELRANGMLGNTYVVYLSDNGFFFGQHRLAKGKYLPYEPSVRTPTVIRGPGIPAGAHSNALVGNVDLAPTLIGLSGATPTKPVDGRSLLPYAENPRRSSNRPILLEANTKDDPSLGIPYTGIRTDRYKYVRYRDGEQELYDLKRDPREMSSKHNDPSYRRTKRALAARLAALQACAGADCREPTGPIPGPKR